MSKKNIKLNLTAAERQSLRKNKVKIADLTSYALDEAEVLLNASKERTQVLFALAAFQEIPSIGIKFAEDLVFLGYYSIAELKGKNGAELVDAYEQKKGYWIDSCVEDQFRLDRKSTRLKTNSGWLYILPTQKTPAKTGGTLPKNAKPSGPNMATQPTDPQPAGMMCIKKNSNEA